MSKVQRFAASLTTGYWPNNPEPLVRDALGDYVKFEDYARLEACVDELVRVSERASKAMVYACHVKEVWCECDKAHDIEDAIAAVQSVRGSK